MNYIIIFFYAFTISYIFIILHEVLHLLCGKLIGFTPSLIYILPLTFYKSDNRWSIYKKIFINKKCTSYTCYNSINFNSITHYKKKLTLLRYYLWIGPIFDFSFFSILIVLGLSYPSTLYYLISACLCLGIATLNFFTIDGKFAIGAKEDERIAYILMNYFTFRSSSIPQNNTKLIMDDIYYNISSNNTQDIFDVHDLWNFLNNISFFTFSLENYMLGNISSIHSNNIKFMDMLINEYDNIAFYDYRQIPKTSKSIITYLIYCNINSIEVTLDQHLEESILSGCSSDYYRNLYYYFIKSDYSLKDYLINSENLGPVFAKSIGLRKFPLDFFKSTLS